MNATTKKKEESNSVVNVKETGAIAKATEFDYGDYAGQGFESHTRDDYAVPFLGVLQSNSPILETVATARPGMIMNTVTQDMYDGKQGITFIPCWTDHVVVEWKPRSQGGGFVASHKLDAPVFVKAKVEQEFGKYKTIKGDEKSNDLIETFYVYGIFIDPTGSYQQMIIACSSTKIKVYKAWMNRARFLQIDSPRGGKVNPPLYAVKYRLTTVPEKNAKGSFYNLSIGFEGGEAKNALIPTNDPLFEAGREFFKLCRDGSVKAAVDTQGAVGAETEESEIPFN